MVARQEPVWFDVNHFNNANNQVKENTEDDDEGNDNLLVRPYFYSCINNTDDDGKMLKYLAPNGAGIRNLKNEIKKGTG